MMNHFSARVDKQVGIEPHNPAHSWDREQGKIRQIAEKWPSAAAESQKNSVSSV
jgi:hypothetical protein